MCIICCKPKGINPPDEATFRRMFSRNPDGAGYMYTDPNDGKVHIRKGLMKIESFLDSVKYLGTKFDLKQIPMVYHFRIGTAGGNIPENTHPYPVSDNLNLLQATSIKTNLGVAHNGIIDITPRKKNINDTMEYIMSQLAPLKRAMPRFYTDKNLVTMVYNAIQSKMAFLNTKGEIFTIGDFQTNNGLIYSNSSYSVDYFSKYSLGSYSYGCGDYGNWSSNCYLDDGYALTRYTDDKDGSIGNVMYLDEGDYIITDDGEMLESTGWDYCIDESDDPYVYDYETDSFFYVGGQAWSINGKVLHFDITKSVEEIVVKNDDKKGGDTK